MTKLQTSAPFSVNNGFNLILGFIFATGKENLNKFS